MGVTRWRSPRDLPIRVPWRRSRAPIDLSQCVEELRDLAAPKLTADHRLFVLIDAVHLKEAISRPILIIVIGRLPWLRCIHSQPGTTDAVGGRPPQHRPERRVRQVLAFGFTSEESPGINGLACGVCANSSEAGGLERENFLATGNQRKIASPSQADPARSEKTHLGQILTHPAALSRQRIAGKNFPCRVD